MNYRLATIGATDDRACFAGNIHRVYIQSETEREYIGWPDPDDKRNSEHWRPGKDKPLLYPRFAWKEIA